MTSLLRSLVRSPGLLVTAVALLALGIGSATALFSVTQAVLLAPLPYKEPERLVRVWSELAARGVSHFPESPSSLEEYRQQASLFERIGGITTGTANYVSAEGDVRQVQTSNGSWDFLEVLGVQPAVGRAFTAEDGAFSASDVAPGSEFPQTTFALPRVALLSDGFARTAFGSATAAIGRFVSVDGVRVEVVGVLPTDFRLHMAAVAGVATDPDVWLPMRVDFAAAPRNNVFLNVVGRLREGVSAAQGKAELDAIAERIYDAYPVMRTAGARLHLAPYAEDLVSDVSGSIWALLGAACFVLLIACANVTGLLLIRTSSRAREFAVRHALGANRGRLFGGVVAETAVLAALGGILGFGVAWIGLKLLLQTAPANIARLDSVGIDGHALAFAILAMFLTTLLAGLLPGWFASRSTSAQTLRDRSSFAIGSTRSRFGLVVGEVALSFVLSVGTGLMARSALELSRTDIGFDAQSLLTFQLDLPFMRYSEPEARHSFLYALQDRLEQLETVTSAAAATPLPLSGQQFNGRYTTERPTGDDTQYRQANYRLVLPGWLETMRTPLLTGRMLTRDDEITGARVVVIDDVLAAASFAGKNPIGQQIWLRIQQPEPEPFEVVGVVRRQLHESLHEPPRETVYFTAGSTGLFAANAWTVRVKGSPDGVLEQLRREVAALDPSLPLANAHMMQDYVDAATARTRFALQLIGSFGFAALLIAMVGLYAAIHTLVVQSHLEIGVRMSIGARKTDIFKMFLKRGITMAALGIAIGLAVALVLSRSLSAFLVNITPTDVSTYVGVTLVFGIVAVAASALPAMGAMRLHPMKVLRSE